MEEILKELERIEGEALKDIERAGDERALEEVKVRYLGRKGRVTACLRQIGQLPKDIRAKVGKRANEANGSRVKFLKRVRNFLNVLP